MKSSDRAVILYYDGETGVLKATSTALSKVEPLIQNRLKIDLPFDSSDVITDEDARKVGGFALLHMAAANPELRNKLRITTALPVDWTPITRPD